MTDTSIAEYALLSDCSSAALVDSSGSVDWLCFGRFDAAPVCARLLDDRAGHWAIRPLQSHRVRREYVPETLILETTFETDDALAALTDAMAMQTGSVVLEPQPLQMLLRRVHCRRGRMTFDLEFAPRPEFGLV